MLLVPHFCGAHCHTFLLFFTPCVPWDFWDFRILKTLKKKRRFATSVTRARMLYLVFFAPKYV